MQDFISPKWADILRRHNLHRFGGLWEADFGWVEKPNEGRGGWSGVSRQRLQGPDGETAGLFIKRQNNHTYKSWRHPLRGEPTFAREMRNILHFQALGVPVPEPVYFAMRKTHGEQRAILITEELLDYVSLEELQQRWLQEPARHQNLKRELMRRLASIVQKMNNARLQHGCLYPKHVFVRIGGVGASGFPEIGDVRLIDLEKAKHRYLSVSCRRRDLSTLNRHSQGLSLSDRMRFLEFYLGKSHLHGSGRRLWRHLARQEFAKRLRRQ